MAREHVQPWGHGACRFVDATAVSYHATAADAYAALDALAARMAATGVAPDSGELIVVDDARQTVRRSYSH